VDLDGVAVLHVPPDARKPEGKRPTRLTGSPNEADSLARTPRIADNAKDSARREAEGRFAQFQEYLVEQFQGGRRFVDDLPREVIADEAELSKMAGEASAPPARVARLLLRGILGRHGVAVGSLQILNMTGDVLSEAALLAVSEDSDDPPDVTAGEARASSGATILDDRYHATTRAECVSAAIRVGAYADLWSGP
jgi:hypothetical protein